MLQALRDLKAAKEEDLLSDEQYEKQRAALLAGEQRWGTSPTTDCLVAMQSQLDRLAERLLPPDKTSSVKTAPAKYKTADGRVVHVQPVAREEGQRSVFSVGVTVKEQRRDGRISQVAEPSRRPSAHTFRCSFAGCSRTFKLAAHLI